MKIIDQDKIEETEDILTKEIINIGVDCVLVIDLAGNLIVNCDNGKCDFDMYALAALSAGSFGAVNAMANIIGEDDFSLLFHKGQKKSLHFTRINEELIIVSVFGPEISLGLQRLKMSNAVEAINKIWV